MKRIWRRWRKGRRRRKRVWWKSTWGRNGRHRGHRWVLRASPTWETGRRSAPGRCPTWWSPPSQARGCRLSPPWGQYWRWLKSVWGKNDTNWVLTWPTARLRTLLQGWAGKDKGLIEVNKGPDYILKHIFTSSNLNLSLFRPLTFDQVAVNAKTFKGKQANVTNSLCDSHLVLVLSAVINGQKCSHCHPRKTNHLLLAKSSSSCKI